MQATTGFAALNESSLKSLIEYYLVANTPGYLVRHYRQQESVRQLAQSTPANELLETALKVDALDERSPRDAALAYATLVALTFKTPREVQAAATGVRFRSLEWADEILSVAMDPVIITSSSQIFAKQRATIAAPTKSLDRSTDILISTKHSTLLAQ